MDGQKIVELIRAGQDDEALEKLYKNYPSFKNSFVKAGGKAIEAEDIFQDALLVFIQKAQTASFQLDCDASTYLYSICRNISLVHFRKKAKEIRLPIEEGKDYSDIKEIELFIEREEKFSMLDNVLKEIGKKCLEILNLFYGENLKMGLIAEKMGFKSETSAKTQKYKCMEKAKLKAKDMLLKNETV